MQPLHGKTSRVQTWAFCRGRKKNVISVTIIILEDGVWATFINAARGDRRTTVTWHPAYSRLWFCPCGGGAGPCGSVHLFFFFFFCSFVFLFLKSGVYSPTCGRREGGRERGGEKVGVHTSCAVWLHGASLEMSSPSRCAHRRILPTWRRRKAAGTASSSLRERERERRGEERREEKSGRLCAAGCRLSTTKVRREEERAEGSGGDRAPRSSPVGNRLSGLCSEMDVNPLLYRRLDRTSGCCCWWGAGEEEEEESYFKPCCSFFFLSLFFFFFFFIKCLHFAHRTQSSSSRAAHLEGRQTSSLSDPQVHSNKLWHYLSASE